MIQEDYASLKKKLKKNLCNNSHFKKLDFNINENHNPYDNVIGFASKDANDFVIGPEECTKDEIVTLLSKSLDLDVIEFDNVERIQNCLIRKIYNYHLSDDSKQNPRNAYENVICNVQSIFTTSDQTHIKNFDCENLKSIPKIASARTIYMYENNENYEFSYDEKRIATMSISYFYSKMIEDSMEELKIAVFPAFLIFELFVYKTACEAFSDKLVRYQETRDYLRSTPYGDVKIRPDVLIKDCEGKDELILDAKYKRLSRNRCYNDVHQMSTYIGCLKRADGILIYPSFLNKEKCSFIKDTNERMGFLMLDVSNYKKSYGSIDWTLRSIHFRQMDSTPKKILYVLLGNSEYMTDSAIKREIKRLCDENIMDEPTDNNYTTSKSRLLDDSIIEKMDDKVGIADWSKAIERCKL